MTSSALRGDCCCSRSKASLTGLGSSLHIAARYDGFVVKLSSAGKGETFGGAGTDHGRGIAVDPAAFVHITGSFQNTVDFNTDPFATFELTAPGTSKGFRLRLRQS
jgi:hypothetical protein